MQLLMLSFTLILKSLEKNPFNEWSRDGSSRLEEYCFGEFTQLLSICSLVETTGNVCVHNSWQTHRTGFEALGKSITGFYGKSK